MTGVCCLIYMRLSAQLRPETRPGQLMRTSSPDAEPLCLLWTDGLTFTTAHWHILAAGGLAPTGTRHRPPLRRTGTIAQGGVVGSRSTPMAGRETRIRMGKVKLKGGQRVRAGASNKTTLCELRVALAEEVWGGRPWLPWFVGLGCTCLAGLDLPLTDQGSADMSVQNPDHGAFHRRSGWPAGGQLIDVVVERLRCRDARYLPGTGQDGSLPRGERQLIIVLLLSDCGPRGLHRVIDPLPRRASRSDKR